MYITAIMKRHLIKGKKVHFRSFKICMIVLFHDGQTSIVNFEEHKIVKEFGPAIKKSLRYL